MIDGLLNVPCTVVRRSAPTTPDEYNDQSPLLEVAESSRCFWEVQRGFESDDKGPTEVAYVVVFLPADTADLEAVDGVQIAGGPIVESWGMPHAVLNARTGVVHHVEMRGKVTA